MTTKVICVLVKERVYPNVQLIVSKLPNPTLDYKFNNVFDIYQDAFDAMWVAGYGQGILYFDKHKSKLLHRKSGLISDHVRCLYAFKNYMYVGTVNGLSIIDLKTHRIVNPTFTKNARHDFTVSSFYEIDYNTPIHKIKFYEAKIHEKILWVASNIGFFQLNLNEELLNYAPVHVLILHFSKDN